MLREITIHVEHELDEVMSVRWAVGYEYDSSIGFWRCLRFFVVAIVSDEYQAELVRSALSKKNKVAYSVRPIHSVE